MEIAWTDIVLAISTVLTVAGAFSAFIIRKAVANAEWKKKIEIELEKFRERLAEDRKEFLEYMHATDARIDKILHKIVAPLPTLGDVVVRKSPYVLSEIGKRVAAIISAYKWTIQLLPLVQDKVAGKPPSQIQEFCFNLVIRDLELTAEQDLKISEAAYENAIPRHDVLYTLAIVLRDILLEREGHPVPKSDPDSKAA